MWLVSSWEPGYWVLLLVLYNFLWCTRQVSPDSSPYPLASYWVTNGTLTPVLTPAREKQMRSIHQEIKRRAQNITEDKWERPPPPPSAIWFLFFRGLTIKLCQHWLEHVECGLNYICVYLRISAGFLEIFLNTPKLTLPPPQELKEKIQCLIHICFTTHVYMVDHVCIPVRIVFYPTSLNRKWDKSSHIFMTLCVLALYSATCLEGTPHGPYKCGLWRQVAFGGRFIYIEI